MESNLRRCCRFDQHPEVRRRRGQHPELGGILTIGSLLNDPNTGSPANVEASNLYKDNRKEYTKRVRETVEKSWED